MKQKYLPNEADHEPIHKQSRPNRDRPDLEGFYSFNKFTLH